MIQKRSSAGLSKPYCFSSSSMNFGSRPCAPRYLREAMSPTACDPPAPICRRRRRTPRSSLVGALELRDRPLDRAAGHELHDGEETAMMPKIVGIISRRRRTT